MNSYTEAVQKAMKGDQEAYTYLYEKTYTKCFYLAKKFLNSEHTAQDIVQDAYVKAFKSLNTLEDPEKFPSWIGTIVSNLSKNELKRRKVTLFSETENEDGQDISDTFVDDRVSVQPEIVMDQNETTRLMKEIIDTLTDEQRICVTMFYMEQMSVKEMASVLEVSENTVKSRLNYGRQKIKDKVLDLEKKGTKLYGLAPIPFFLLLLKEDVKAAQATQIPSMSAAVSSATKAVATAAGTGSTVAGTTAATVAAGAGKGIATKVIAGIVAGALVVGGGAAAIVHMQGQSGNHYKLAKSISDLPDWAYDSTNGLKYISIQDYKYPISLILDYDKDMVERGEVKYYSNPGHTGYEGMKCDPKVWYFGEYNGRIYYVDRANTENLRYHLYRVPKASDYDLYLEDSDTYMASIFNDLNARSSDSFLFTYDEDEHNQYVAIEDMINSDGYSFDEWYCITEDDLIPDAVDAYNDWVANGEAEMNAIYASHITVTESVPETETETEEVVEEVTEEPTETAPEETEVQEAEGETVDQSGNIPVPNYTPTGNFWNTPGSYSSNDGQTLSLSMFTEDGGVEGWCGNINGGSVGSLEVFNYGDKIYYLKKADSSYSNFTDSGYAFTLEPSGEILDIYGETYDIILLKLYYNGVLQGEYYETELYQS